MRMLKMQCMPFKRERTVDVIVCCFLESYNIIITQHLKNPTVKKERFTELHSLNSVHQTTGDGCDRLSRGVCERPSSLWGKSFQLPPGTPQTVSRQTGVHRHWLSPVPAHSHRWVWHVSLKAWHQTEKTQNDKEQFSWVLSPSLVHIKSYT